MGHDGKHGTWQNLPFGSIERVAGLAHSKLVFACGLGPLDPLPYVDRIASLARTPDGLSIVSSMRGGIGLKGVDVAC